MFVVLKPNQPEETVRNLYGLFICPEVVWQKAFKANFSHLQLKRRWREFRPILVLK